MVFLSSMATLASESDVEALASWIVDVIGGVGVRGAKIVV
jgi:hypothetical protein